MNKKLLNAVELIVSTYGKNIVSEKRFWAMLCDSYLFYQEPDLKACFQNCINKGYQKEILNLSGKRKATNDLIQSIVNNECYKDLSKAYLYFFCLYSLAIALGNCKEKDFDESVKNFTESLKPKPSPTPNPPLKPSKRNPLFPTFKALFWRTFWGIAILLGSSCFYGAYLFHG